jgi:hypothetical protein
MLVSEHESGDGIKRILFCSPLKVGLEKAWKNA